MSSRYTREERVQKAVELYNSGKTLKTIGSIFRVTAVTVMRYLEEAGVPRRARGRRVVAVA